jgi:hypothetical protein
MEQILAVLTLYLATVRLGTVACKTAPQRLIIGGTKDRNIMSAGRGRKPPLASPVALTAGLAPSSHRTPLFLMEKRNKRLCAPAHQANAKIIARGLFGGCCLAISESREASAMFSGS